MSTYQHCRLDRTESLPLKPNRHQATTSSFQPVNFRFLLRIVRWPDRCRCDGQGGKLLI